jgi:hypothetical protein
LIQIRIHGNEIGIGASAGAVRGCMPAIDRHARLRTVVECFNEEGSVGLPNAPFYQGGLFLLACGSNAIFISRASLRA